MPEGGSGASILLDACAILNLYASRRFDDVLESLPGRAAIGSVVQREAQWIRTGGSGDDRDSREPIDLKPSILAGRLLVLDIRSDGALETYIDLAIDLDDGEAHTAAVALERGYLVVTDDRKARRILGERGVRVISTLAVVRAWTDAAGMEPEAIRVVLNDIRERANFVPPRSDPVRVWWQSFLEA